MPVDRIIVTGSTATQPGESSALTKGTRLKYVNMSQQTGTAPVHARVILHTGAAGVTLMKGWLRGHGDLASFGTLQKSLDILIDAHNMELRWLFRNDTGADQTVVCEWITEFP